jgi:hypothetical protein
MTTIEAARSGQTGKLRKLALQLGTGMIGGLAVGGVAAASGLFDALETLDPFLIAALLMGVGLFFGGLVVAAASYRPRALTAMMLEGGGEGEATPREAEFYRLAGWVMTLAGLLAAIPPLAAGLFDPLEPSAAWTVLAALIVISLVQVALNVRLWRAADELTRRVTFEAACIAFFIVEGLLFLWAAAEVMGLAPAVSAWAVWTLMFAAYLFVAGWVSYRRGVG